MSDDHLKSNEYQEFIKKHQKAPVIEYPNNVLKAIPDPVVSCRISTYQHAPYIRQCIEGVLMQQTEFTFEIVIGEDESTDGTREICIEYATKYPDKIRLFLHDRRNNIKINGKPSSKFQGTFTKAHCRGIFIAICEGDDFWIDPLKLQSQVDFLRQNQDCNICATRALHWIVEGIPGSYLNPKEGLSRITIDQLFDGNGGIVNTCTFLSRRYSRENSIEWSRNIIGGDWVMLVNSLNDGSYCAVLPRVTAVYRVHKGGVWRGVNRTRVQVINNILSYLNAYKKIVNKDYAPILCRRIKYYEAAHGYYSNGRLRGGMHLIKMIIRHPSICRDILMSVLLKLRTKCGLGSG